MRFYEKYITLSQINNSKSFMRLKKQLGLLCLSILVMACGRKSEEPKPEPTRKLVGSVETKIYHATLDQGKFVKGELLGTIEEEFDSDSRLTRMVFIPFDPEGRNDDPQHQIHNYKYNDKGQLMEELVANQDGGNKFRTVYSYDEGGRLVSELTYEGDDTGFPARKEYTKYNAEGKPIEGLENDRNKFTLKYDDHGNITEWVLYSSDNANQMDRRIRRHYEYDAGGNWVKQYRSVENGSRTSELELETDYYILERGLV